MGNWMKRDGERENKKDRIRIGMEERGEEGK